MDMAPQSSQLHYSDTDIALIVNLLLINSVYPFSCFRDHVPAFTYSATKIMNCYELNQVTGPYIKITGRFHG